RDLEARHGSKRSDTGGSATPVEAVSCQGRAQRVQGWTPAFLPTLLLFGLGQQRRARAGVNDLAGSSGQQDGAPLLPPAAGRSPAADEQAGSRRGNRICQCGRVNENQSPTGCEEVN